MGASVVTGGDGAESLLTGSVPLCRSNRRKLVNRKGGEGERERRREGGRGRARAVASGYVRLLEMEI